MDSIPSQDTEENSLASPRVLATLIILCENQMC